MSLENSKRSGLKRLLQQLRETETAEQEMSEERGRFQRLAGDSAKPRAVSSFNLFQTPELIAARIADLLNVDDSHRVLEPSAGLGRLYRAVRSLSACPVVLVEQSPDCCAELYRETEGDHTATLIQDDFLQCDPDRLGGLFDRVIMNPPFKRGTDIKHIEHARELLKPGGLLVAICANGPRQQKRYRDNSELFEVLPSGSFKETGTNVEASILILER